MNNNNPYFKELGDIHAEIQALFDGSADDGALQRIVARFAPQFTMVMPSGIAVDHAGVRELFGKLRGARPGSQITIRDMEIVADYGSGAVVKYREYQRDGAGNANVRRSTAVLDLDAHGKVTWCHLHETYCTE
ncbi:nuclear transport factor 2 family protein [Paraburkholderia strydomiana]|uniref:Nuclear transport factor 2 family protein n=1 Tax=Paraburkholderia strydomiana TaxID=1245417 RepID=A0ABW9EI77_9BURK